MKKNGGTGMHPLFRARVPKVAQLTRHVSHLDTWNRHKASITALPTSPNGLSSPVCRSDLPLGRISTLPPKLFITSRVTQRLWRECACRYQREIVLLSPTFRKLGNPHCLRLRGISSLFGSLQHGIRPLRTLRQALHPSPRFVSLIRHCICKSS
jgi:hypothetical protein